MRPERLKHKGDTFSTKGEEDKTTRALLTPRHRGEAHGLAVLSITLSPGFLGWLVWADDSHVTETYQRDFTNRFCETCCSFPKSEIMCPMAINKTDKGTCANAKMQTDAELSDLPSEKQRRVLRDSMAKPK